MAVVIYLLADPISMRRERPLRLPGAPAQPRQAKGVRKRGFGNLLARESYSFAIN
jgi:hypothetical protein